MKIPFLRILLCIAIFGITLYAYVENRNRLTKLRLGIPALEKELHEIWEENIRLQYEIERFESPIHLMELWRQPEYSHFRHPLLEEVVIIHE